MSSIILQEDLITASFYIKFYPGIKSSLGCEKATLILGRLEYWFEKYTNGFYKFIEPCAHPLYREGDSWSEEIGFSRKIFAKAFDLIGVRHKSKSDFMKAKDKFHGKLYASYHDRKTNQTYFVRNHEFASNFIKDLFRRKTCPIPSIAQKVDEKKTTLIDTTPSLIQGRSRNGQKCRSSGGTIGGKTDRSIQRNNSSLKPSPQNALRTPIDSTQKKVTEEMIKIWEEEIGELGTPSLSTRFLEKLFESFKSFFANSLSAWQDYCRMISSSKFLMGEAQNKFFKKAWITWAIKEETIERIKGGEFKLGDRSTKLDEQIQKINLALDALESQKKGIEKAMENIKQLIERERLEKVRETTKVFSGDQIEQFKSEFEKQLECEDNSLTKEFKRAGWKGLFIETYFDSFLIDQIGNQLFNTSIEEETNQKIKDSGLLETLRMTSDEICKLRTKRQFLAKQKE